MSRTKHGFTIVELLIVIVVIAILAAISVVAYNGIQSRAKNAQTVSAAAAWVKILKLYNADKGVWPTQATCLGTMSTYVGNGGQCFNDPFWVVKQNFLNEMTQYTSVYPEPDISDAASGQSYSPRRGLLYNTNGSTYWQIYLYQSGSGSCPSIGINLASGPTTQGSGYQCIYTLV